MKLKDVKHKENWCGTETEDNFSFHNNRFYLFDCFGRELNSFSMERVPNVLELNVLEIKRSGYAGYGVGFPTTHIKLDYLNENNISSYNFKFGDYDTRL